VCRKRRRFIEHRNAVSELAADRSARYGCGTMVAAPICMFLQRATYSARSPFVLAVTSPMTRLYPYLLAVALLAMALTACNSNGDNADTPPLPRTVAETDFTTTSSGLQYYDFA